MGIDTWDEIRTAYQVARLGTVSGAAEVLGVHHATVIRHIDALEKRLGVKLFQRHARGEPLPARLPRDLLAALRFAAYGFAAMGLLLAGIILGVDDSALVGLGAVGLVFAGLIHWGLTSHRDTTVPAWFTLHFRWVVWGSTLLFGLIHLGNFTALTHPLGLLVLSTLGTYAVSSVVNNLTALLVTRSEEGMTLYRADGAVHEPTLAQEVYDVSGAGDTVIGTLGLMLAAGLELPVAMRLANAAAGIVVAKLGTAVCHQRELFAL